jgi:hypothetical protein
MKIAGAATELSTRNISPKRRRQPVPSVIRVQKTNKNTKKYKQIEIKKTGLLKKPVFFISIYLFLNTDTAQSSSSAVQILSKCLAV